MPSTTETTKVLVRLSRAQVDQAARRTARRIGIGRPSAADLASIPVPDTPTSRAARALIAEWGSPALVNHSHRTYAFGALLGGRDGLDWDAEALFVAAMLHDAGLTGRLPRDRPFEVEGAEHARGFLAREGWSEPRRELSARAIEMHMQLGLAARDRPEIALLHFGAAADVTGMRLEDLPAETVARVVADHPREDFKATFCAHVRDEARRHPRSTTALLCRWGQFTWRINRAPFDS